MSGAMALTAELVARAHRAVEDLALPPDLVRCTDVDFDAAVAKILASRPRAQEA